MRSIKQPQEIRAYCRKPKHLKEWKGLTEGEQTVSAPAANAPPPSGPSVVEDERCGALAVSPPVPDPKAALVSCRAGVSPDWGQDAVVEREQLMEVGAAGDAGTKIATDRNANTAGAPIGVWAPVGSLTSR